MPTLAAVVFDMDGTLFDSWQMLNDAFIVTVQQAGGPTYTPEQVTDAYRFGPARKILDHLLGEPSTEADLAEYHARVRRDAWSVRPYPGIPEILEQLAARLKLAVFTGADVQSADTLLGATDLRENFEVVVGGDEVDTPKPSPDGLLLTCRRLGVEPSKAAYVGDSPLDVGAAKNAGVLAIAAAWGHLQAEGADIIANRPQDLLDLTT